MAGSQRNKEETATDPLEAVEGSKGESRLDDSPSPAGPGAGKRLLRWARGIFPVAVILVVGLCLTFVAFQVTRDLYRSVAEQEFDRQASHYILALNKAVDRHLQLMESAGSLFDDSTAVTARWDLFNFAKERLAYYPGFEVLAWVPIVPMDERETYVRRAEADGLSGFEFSEITGTGRVVEAARRPEHLPIYYLEPYNGNDALLGFDLASIPEFRSALAQSGRDGKLKASDWVDPRGEPYENGKTLMLIQPVFGAGANLGPARPGPRGYLIGLIRIDRLFGTTLREFTTPAWLDTYLYHSVQGTGAKLVHVEPSVLRSGDLPAPAPGEIGVGFATMGEQSIADRRYSIVVRPVPGTIDFELGVVPWGVALFGLALTLLLMRYIAVSRHKQRQIEIAVVERTAELSRANEANARLEQEIHERKRVEAELRTAKDEAEVASRAKSEFLAMVSHELRTPLNAIIGFSEMLTNEMFGPIGDRRYRGYAADIRNSGLHLLSLINDILDLSKVEANSFELNEQELDVPQLVSETLRLVESKATDGGITLYSRPPADLPHLRADQRALKQVVLNLLSNAIKFTPPGGRVTVSCSLKEGGEFAIIVTDSGIGIAKQDQERILKPFTQVDSSLARQYEGTGLGLPLTKSLVELHGGWLDLESRPNMGTRVAAYFPNERVVRRRVAAE